MKIIPLTPKLLGSMLICLLITGCGTTANKDYQRLIDTNKVADSNSAAIENSTHLPLTPEKALETAITLDDPVIQFKNYRSNYKIVTFEANKGSNYTIELRSLCNCLGFTKTIVHPVAYLLNSEGQVVNNKPDQLKQGSMGFSYPMNIHGIWSGKIATKGKYYFLIAADNSNLEQQELEIFAAAGPSTFVHIPVSRDLVGEFEVKLVLN